MRFEAANWNLFSTCFEISPDTTEWDLSYEKVKGSYGPSRPIFKLPLMGMKPRSEFVGLSAQYGVYLIGYQGKIIYVGHACGSETIRTRLAKHRIKLTGSSTPGVTHPERWRTFTTSRFRKFPRLVQSEVLTDFSFSYLPTTTTSEGYCRLTVKSLEAAVYSLARDLQNEEPRLNDPGKISKTITMPVKATIKLPT